jgi:hypothetical protein
MRALKQHDGAEVLLALALYIDVSFVKVHLSVKPIFGNLISSSLGSFF